MGTTDEAKRWFTGLDDRRAEQVAIMLNALQEQGPALSGPLCKRIRHSRHHNMKELRSVGGHLRILFAFDPQRRAIILTGGDKAGNWTRFYTHHIPLADRLLDEHLRTCGREGPWRTGVRSSARGR